MRVTMISMEQKSKKIRVYKADLHADLNDIELFRFGDDCLEMTVEQLFFSEYQTDGICDAFDIGCVLMDGFGKEEIYKLLAGMDPVIPVVLTEHNRKWTVRDLLNEAYKEHKWFIVNDLMKDLNEKDLSGITGEDKNLIMNAWMALQKEEDVSSFEVPLQEILKKV